MKIENMNKEDLELLNNKDITNMILEENGNMNTLEIYTKIIKLLELPKSYLETKIGDFYTSLTTDKRFVLLEDGTWDLRKRHTLDKVKVIKDDDDDDDDTDVVVDDEVEDEVISDNYSDDDDMDDFDDTEEKLKDLVIVDEDELELEE